MNFLLQVFRKLSYYSLRMRAFSYAWSLPVTWQRWRSHHSIRHSRKPQDTRKPHGSISYRTGVMGERSLHCGNRDFQHFAPVTSTLTRWPSYTNCPYSRAIHRMCKYELPIRQGFRKLSSDRQTDGKIRQKLYNTPLRGWSIVKLSYEAQTCALPSVWRHLLRGEYRQPCLGEMDSSSQLFCAELISCF